MDLVSQFIFLVIFGLVGAIIGYFTGFNPANLWSNLTMVPFLAVGCYFVVKMSISPESGVETLASFFEWFANNLPGIIIGDAAGAVVGAVVGEITNTN